MKDSNKGEPLGQMHIIIMIYLKQTLLGYDLYCRILLCVVGCILILDHYFESWQRLTYLAKIRTRNKWYKVIFFVFDGLSVKQLPKELDRRKYI